MKPKKVRKRQVVYLGGETSHEFKPWRISNSKIERLANLFRNINFTNINLDLVRSFREKNYFRQKADFLKGLEKCKDKSIDILRSEMALGYFSFKNGNAVDKYSDSKLTNDNITAYTARVLKIAKKKLTNYGKIVIIAENSGDFGATAFYNIRTAAEINKMKFSFRPITKAEVRNGEFWTRHAHSCKKKLFVITLTK